MQCIRSDLVKPIRSLKEKFNLRLSDKLSDPSTSAKTYWSIRKTFLNGKKVQLIPPLLVTEKFDSNILEKANIFNDIFSQSISNDRILLLISSYCTDNRLNDIYFNYNKVIKVIEYLDPNKAHSHDSV